jgi:hypothetical protein
MTSMSSVRPVADIRISPVVSIRGALAEDGMSRSGGCIGKSPLGRAIARELRQDLALLLGDALERTHPDRCETLPDGLGVSRAEPCSHEMRGLRGAPPVLPRDSWTRSFHRNLLVS